MLYFIIATISLLNIFVLFSEARVVFCVIYFIIFILLMALILFISNLEFFGILLILVYIGAIIVLFIFVILMLNVYKEILFNVYSSFFKFIYFSLVLLNFIFMYTFIYINYSFINISLFNILYIDFFFSLNSLSSFEVLGLVLYTYYIFLLVIVTLILFISMFGSIALVYIENPRVIMRIGKIKYVFKSDIFHYNYLKCIY